MLFQKNIDNDVGTKNNLVSVRKSDFEVFQALAKDSEGAGTSIKEYSQVMVFDNRLFLNFYVLALKSD